MSIAAPTYTSPVNSLASDLPFVDPSAGAHFADAILSMFANSIEEKEAQTMMLHLRAKNGPVLLEMVANVFGENDDSLVVVLIGRAVDAELATLMAGCGEPENDGNASESKFSTISALTMATLYTPPSEQVSADDPVFLELVGDAVGTDPKGFVVPSPSSTTFAKLLSRVMKGRQAPGLVDDGNSVASTNACGSTDSGREGEHTLEHSVGSRSACVRIQG